MYVSTQMSPFNSSTFQPFNSLLLLRHHGHAGLVEGGWSGKLRTVRAADSYVPLGDAANVVLVGEDDIVAATREVLA